jgi:hypothetical protein
LFLAVVPPELYHDSRPDKRVRTCWSCRRSDDREDSLRSDRRAAGGWDGGSQTPWSKAVNKRKQKTFKMIQ